MVPNREWQRLKKMVAEAKTPSPMLLIWGSLLGGVFASFITLLIGLALMPAVPRWAWETTWVITGNSILATAACFYFHSKKRGEASSNAAEILVEMESFEQVRHGNNRGQ